MNMLISKGSKSSVIDCAGSRRIYNSSWHMTTYSGLRLLSRSQLPLVSCHGIPPRAVSSLSRPNLITLPIRRKPQQSSKMSSSSSSKNSKSDQEWRDKLTPEQYKVLRLKGTEPPFSGKYLKLKDNGVYQCAACNQPLYESDTKFDASCGWPAFYDAIPGAVNTHKDTSHGMVRTEMTCSKCGSHLGHVFEGEGYDTPTNIRHCVNSVCLNFKSN